MIVGFYSVCNASVAFTSLLVSVFCESELHPMEQIPVGDVILAMIPFLEPSETIKRLAVSVYALHLCIIHSHKLLRIFLS